MKSIVIALILFLLVGCGLVESVTTPNAAGEVPINEGLDAGLSALTNGGWAAGIAAFVFTTAKTAMRIKKKVAAAPTA